MRSRKSSASESAISARSIAAIAGPAGFTCPAGTVIRANARAAARKAAAGPPLRLSFGRNSAMAAGDRLGPALSRLQPQPLGRQRLFLALHRLQLFQLRGRMAEKFLLLRGFLYLAPASARRAAESRQALCAAPTSARMASGTPNTSSSAI